MNGIKNSVLSKLICEQMPLAHSKNSNCCLCQKVEFAPKPQQKEIIIDNFCSCCCLFTSFDNLTSVIGGDSDGEINEL